jgi:hypothetical protein
MLMLVLVAVTTTSCGGEFRVVSALMDARESDVNFRLLISDEPNAIEDFEELNVTITRVGAKQSGASGDWIEFDIDPAVGTVDLTQLQGSNAAVIWSGQLEAGTYDKVFVYVSEVTGILLDGEASGDDPEVKLPGGKLHISKPFEVGEDASADFVFDITVIKAGRSGKYVLKPQVDQSGPDQWFTEVSSSSTVAHSPSR